MAGVIREVSPRVMRAAAEAVGRRQEAAAEAEASAGYVEDGAGVHRRAGESE